MGVAAHFMDLVESQYEHNLMAVRTNDEISKVVGCILFPAAIQHLYWAHYTKGSRKV